jgi:hypothetical protein
LKVVHAMMIRRAVFALLVATTMLCRAAGGQSLPLEQIRLPSGFTIELVARVPGARQMTFGANGTLFAGSRRRAK